MTRQAVYKIFSFIIILALFTSLGWFANDWLKRDASPKDRRISKNGFIFISPLLDIELPEGFSVKHDPIPFKHKVKAFVDQQIKTGKAKQISVYYRDMLDGPWFGINEDISYNPASMMKISVMIAWLKRAEQDKSVLKRKIIYHENAMYIPPQRYKPKQTLKDGISYTVEELLKYMMNYSDNRALSLLHFALTPEEHANVLAGMNVVSKVVGGKNSISAHSFSGFLRILYNASYLTDEMSEKALELMHFDDFSTGIVAGIPKDTVLASKFGEYLDVNDPDGLQLHEFGIVYHPRGPYILGIMTKGHNWEGQADIIMSVS